MKKNRTMRLAALLLVLTLITSCFVGGTFAKYVTTADGTDTARVAYWGFEQLDDNTITLDNLFVYNDSGVHKDGSVDGLIAPGTTNKKDFQFKYVTNAGNAVDKPEVAYTFTVDTTGSAIDPELVNNTNIQWRLNKVSTKGKIDDEGTWGTFATMINDIKALSGDASGSKDYAPNTLPEAFENGDEVYTVEWQWIFEDTAHTNEDKDAYEDQDETDTALGNADPLNDVTVTVTITATQLNTYPAG